MLREVYDKESKALRLVPDNKLDTIKKTLIGGRFLRELRRVLKIGKLIEQTDRAIGGAVRRIRFRKEPIVQNRAVFFNFQGKYTCNSKYIAEKILETHPEFEVIFIVNKGVMKDQEYIDSLPEKIRLVVRDTPEAYYVLSTAHFWFDNALNCIWRKIPKRKGQIYINTWHGSLGIKRLSGDDNWIKIAKYGNSQIDYFLTNSVFDEEVFTESFWPDVKHLKVGHPRNDIFFDECALKRLKEKVYDYYDIEPEVKTLLYAPTFRDDKQNVSAIIMDYEKVHAALVEKFGGEWKIFVRPHFHNLSAFKLNLSKEAKKIIVDASKYDDMQELMAAADIGVTDYSSWIFDYIFTGRPAFIYARDIEEYVNSRGFYYSLNETPFEIASDDDCLCDNIRNYDSEKYKTDVSHFLEGKGCYEAGKASEQVVQFMVDACK